MIFIRRFLRSFKLEIQVIFATVFVLLLLPLIAIVTIANAGVAEVAQALAALNPITHLIEIHDANGLLVSQIEATTVWPVSGKVTLNFGEPDPPFQLRHTGIDIANTNHRSGDAVTPFMSGKIITALENTRSGYGNYIVIDHGNHVKSLYAHLTKILISKDHIVKPGDVIGLEGQTGYATGPHLHFEIQVYDIPVNPRTFLVGEPIPGLPTDNKRPSL